MAKLSLSQMLSIRERWGNKTATQVELAAEFNVTRQAIWRVVHHKTWRSF